MKIRDLITDENKRINAFAAKYGFPMRGNEKTWTAVVKTLNELSIKKEVSTLRLFGEYGSGKTLTLLKIKKNIEDKKILADKALIVYIEADPEPPNKVGVGFIQSIFSNIDRIKLLDIVEKTDIKKLKNLLSEESYEMFYALHKGNTRVYDWLTGSSIKQDDKTYKINTIKQSLTVLEDFLVILNSSGYDSLIILLDEFEYLINMYSEKKITSLSLTFLKIYENYLKFLSSKGDEIANMIFILACTPLAWEYLIKQKQASHKKTGGGGIVPWLERIGSTEPINLAPLELTAVKEIIEDRLKSVYDSIDNKLKPPSSTYPFLHPEAIKSISKQAQGNPRKIIQLADVIFKTAFDKNVEIINGNFVERVLKEKFLFKKDFKE